MSRLTAVLLALAIVLPTLASAQQIPSPEACANQTVAEWDLREYFNRQAPLREWDRPIRNASDPMVVGMQLGMSSFAMIVIYCNQISIKLGIKLFFYILE